ncbi:uncharacterized protein METZ01_LOCUS417557 [marine metagenome]|uniref:Outer membrane protein beta-barrel domain-containing protein n=1 Tax=marine metagenome TaxID=408172 RepID=A0A382X150_9ZZZZ
MKKIILTVFAASSLLLYSTQAFALLNFSVGVPLSHTITGKYSDGTEIKSEGVSGTFIQVGVPMLPGIGMDSYKTKIESDDPFELETMIYNLYYLLPIPIINLTLGVGTGSTTFKCSDCDAYFDKGSASQWYASFGMPIIPLFDLHLSYRSVSSKIKTKSGSIEHDLSGNIMGLGIGFNF